MRSCACKTIKGRKIRRKKSILSAQIGRNPGNFSWKIYSFRVELTFSRKIHIKLSASLHLPSKPVARQQKNEGHWISIDLYIGSAHCCSGSDRFLFDLKSAFFVCALNLIEFPWFTQKKNSCSPLLVWRPKNASFWISIAFVYMSLIFYTQSRIFNSPQNSKKHGDVYYKRHFCAVRFWAVYNLCCRELRK